MRSSHDEARADHGPAVELVLTGQRLPRFALLLAAMLAELTLAPFIDMLPHGLVLVQVLTASVLLAALAVAGSHRLAIVLFTGALLVHLAASVSAGSVLTAAGHALRVVFLCYVAGLVLRRVLADRTVTLDTVAGAACVYMLLGVAWGSLFLLLESWRPGSFHVPATWTLGSASDLRSSLMYFSFATLTTLGYGEIHPNDPAAGSLCAAEAVIGQLYLAIMIARLVGLHTSRAASAPGRPGAEA
jgi:hypothetical protein